MTSKRALTYARQSLTRGPQDDSLSIEMQTRACREYIARQGWELCGTFEDPDQKGWKAHRPAFDAMLDRFRQGAADIVVVFKLSRFARDLLHQERIIGEIADAGGELASVTEPYISTSPMVRQILGAVNEQFRRDQGDFLKATWAGRARRGYHHGGAPYGYRMEDGELAVDEPAASVVREMFSWALAGHGSPEIASRLNARNVPTPRAGQQWTEERVLRLLRRPAYCGRVMLNGEIVTDEGRHEPLVSPVTFDAVQLILDRRRGTRRKDAPSWVDGFVRHACGRRMYAAMHVTATSRGWRYRCGATTANAAKHEHCDARPGSMMVGKVEAAFVSLLGDALTQLVPPDRAAARLEAAHAADAVTRDAERARLARRLAEVERQRDRLLDLTLQGHVAEDAYTLRDATLRAERDRIRATLAELPTPVNPAALARRHATLVEARAALEVAIRHDPAALPGVLHALDVTLVIGDGAPRLAWGPETGVFVGGS